MKLKRLKKTTLATLAAISLAGTLNPAVSTAATSKGHYDRIEVRPGEKRVYPLRGVEDPFCMPREITVGGDIANPGPFIGVVHQDCSLHIQVPKWYTRLVTKEVTHLNTVVDVYDDANPGPSFPVKSVVTIIPKLVPEDSGRKPSVFDDLPPRRSSAHSDKTDVEYYNEHHRPHADHITVDLGGTARGRLYDLPSNARIYISDTESKDVHKWARIEGHTLVVSPKKGQELVGKYKPEPNMLDALFGTGVMLKFVFPDYSARSLLVPLTINGARDYSKNPQRVSEGQNPQYRVEGTFKEGGSYSIAGPHIGVRYLHYNNPFTLRNAPSWASIDANTGRLTLTRVPGGTQRLTVVTTYSDGSTDTTTVTIPVQGKPTEYNKHYQPQYTAKTVTEGQSSTITKPSGVNHVKSFALGSGAPSWARMNRDGSITITRVPKGTYRIPVTVTYTDNTTDTTTIKVTSNKSYGNTYRPVYKSKTLTEGTSGTITKPSGVDHVKSFALGSGAPGWARINRDGSITLNRVPKGTYSLPVTVTYTDNTTDMTTVKVIANARPTEYNRHYQPQYTAKTVTEGQSSTITKPSGVNHVKSFALGSGAPSWARMNRDGSITITRVPKGTYRIPVTVTYTDSTTDTTTIKVVANARPTEYNKHYQPQYAAKILTEGTSGTITKPSGVNHVKSFALGSGAPSWARMNHDGSITITRVPQGTHRIPVTVTYTDNTTDTTTVKVIANARPTEYNKHYQPRYTDKTLTEGQSSTVTRPSDVKHVKSFALGSGAPSWARINNDGSITITRVPQGTHRIPVTVTYTDNTTDKATVTVTATAKPKPAPAPAPKPTTTTRKPAPAPRPIITTLRKPAPAPAPRQTSTVRPAPRPAVITTTHVVTPLPSAPGPTVVTSIKPIPTIVPKPTATTIVKPISTTPTESAIPAPTSDVRTEPTPDETPRLSVTLPDSTDSNKTTPIDTRIEDEDDWGNSTTPIDAGEKAPLAPNTVADTVDVDDFNQDNTVGIVGANDANDADQAAQKDDGKKTAMVVGAVGLVGVIAAIVMALQSNPAFAHLLPH